VSDLAAIRIVGFPLAAFQHTQQHHDELFREFALILSREPTPGHSVPGRLLALIEELDAQFSGFGIGPQAEIEAAAARNEQAIDLVYEMPSEVRDACVRLIDLLREADEYCRHGDLLTLAPPPDAVAMREWFLHEFINQIDGHPPTSWDEYRRRAS